MSITLSSWQPARCFPQSFWTLAIAWVDFGVIPVTYSRRTYFARSRFAAAFSNSSVLVFTLLLSMAVTPKLILSSGDRTNVEPHQHALCVSQISDNLFKRFRKLPYQCRYGNNLVPFSKLGIL